MRRTTLLLSAVLAGVLLAPGPAQATPMTTSVISAQATLASLDEVVDELRSDQVYLDPKAEIDLDEQDVRRTLADSEVQVYLAAVPEALSQDSGGDAALVQALGQALGDPSSVVLLLTDAPSVYADNSSALGDRGVNAGQAVRSIKRGEFDRAGLSAFLSSFVDAVDTQVAQGGTGGSGGGSSDGGSGAGALLPLLLVGGAGFGGYALLRARRRAKTDAQDLQDARADVESIYGRLGSDVSLIAPGEDAIARQALADAAERFGATGALMARADTPGEFAAARRTAVEGLAMTRVARERLGLDPGPEVALPAGEGPALEAPARVEVGDQTYEACPRYEPGRPHYYAGGHHGSQHVPGGWYAVPFWQFAVMTGSLGGAPSRSGRSRGASGRGSPDRIRSTFGGFGGGGGWGGGRRGGGGGGGW